MTIDKRRTRQRFLTWCRTKTYFCAFNCQNGKEQNSHNCVDHIGAVASETLDITKK